MRLIVAFLAVLFSAGPCLAWSEGGHHLIAVMAFDLLTVEQQAAVLEVLKSHPRFEQDFKIPENVSDPERYLIGRAAYWPDVARKTEYDRPTWHYQLGAALSMDGAKAPANPGPCPPDATLQTQDLHIAQAVELCRRILKDKSQPAADRAIALCWIGHLVGDAHQPCRSGSLYCKLFPEGDRGANSIPTKQSRNMHALWDGLLGPRFDEGDVRRRSTEYREMSVEWPNAAEFTDGLTPVVWLTESAIEARSYVYTDQVRQPVIKAGDEGTKIEPINLTEGYLKNAGIVASGRSVMAAQRLAKILAEDIGPEK